MTAQNSSEITVRNETPTDRGIRIPTASMPSCPPADQPDLPASRMRLDMNEILGLKRK